ncbi:MAG TPA: hypothetical protein VE733_17450 [Streptosporangiaceae bacterium]|jgi:hypothetical protein|nr:hypothetical protein [Streptosporangiaceae bacterium]
MGRPADWTPLGLDSDPVPGDPAAIGRESAYLASVATTISQEIAALQKIAAGGADGALKGQYATKIHSAASDLASKLGDVVGRYQKVSSALSQWAPDLEQAQAQSVTALDDAEAPYRTISQQVALPSGSNLTPQQKQQIQDYHTAMNRAQQQLDAAKALLAKAVSFRDNRASHYAGLIRSAIDDRVKDSWWQSHILDNGLMQWVDQHADALTKIADVLGWIATAVAIIALFIPGLNILAFALLGALLLIHTLLAADGKGSWLSVVLDIVSIVTLGMGLAAARGLSTAEQTAQGVLKGGADELGSQAWTNMATATKAVRSAAGKVFANDALRGTQEWTNAQSMASTAMKAMWGAKNSAIRDATQLAQAEFKPGFVQSYLAGGQEAAGIRQFFTKAAARFPGYKPLADAIAQGMPEFNLGQRLFLGSSGVDYTNHILGGSPVIGWSGFDWYNNATTIAVSEW